MNTFFPKGNLDIWNYCISNTLPKGMNVIIRILVPTVEAALKELVGETGSFEREVGQINFLENKDMTPAGIEGILEYMVPAFKVAHVPEEAVNKDQNFINEYLIRINDVDFKPTSINTETGKVTIKFSFEIGGME